MIIQVFGKEDCARCRAVKKKLRFFLEKWDLQEQVPVQFVDLATVDGFAEAAFHDVHDIPTTLLHSDGETSSATGEMLARWDGCSPRSRELGQHLKGLASASPD